MMSGKAVKRHVLFNGERRQKGGSFDDDPRGRTAHNKSACGRLIKRVLELSVVLAGFYLIADHLLEKSASSCNCSQKLLTGSGNVAIEIPPQANVSYPTTGLALVASPVIAEITSPVKAEVVTPTRNLEEIPPKTKVPSLPVPVVTSVTPSRSNDEVRVVLHPKSPPSFDSCELDLVGGIPGTGYGAWPLCVNQVPKGAIVFSIGIGGDVSFDVAMIKRGAFVHAFDPTVEPEKVKSLFTGPNEQYYGRNFTFLQVGLGPTNAVVPFSSPKNKRVKSMTSVTSGLAQKLYDTPTFEASVLTLPNLMNATKVDYIDLLKIDVEGIEFDVCDSPAFLAALDKVGHLIIELHERLLQGPRGRKARCRQRLLSKGFKLVAHTRTEEYVYSRISPTAKIKNISRRQRLFLPV